SKACSVCHAEIARSYLRTSMARSSGKVGDGAFQESFDSARFSDPALGVEYRISLSTEGYRLEFRRPAKDIKGERLLTWFVGSGRVARSYVAESGGFLFQA